MNCYETGLPDFFAAYPQCSVRYTNVQVFFNVFYVTAMRLLKERCSGCSVMGRRYRKSIAFTNHKWKKAVNPFLLSGSFKEKVNICILKTQTGDLKMICK